MWQENTNGDDVVMPYLVWGWKKKRDLAETKTEQELSRNLSSQHYHPQHFQETVVELVLAHIMPLIQML